MEISAPALSFESAFSKLVDRELQVVLSVSSLKAVNCD